MSKENTNKVQLYDSQLKYYYYNDFDVENIYWEDLEKKEKYIKGEYNNLEHRLLESKKNNYEYLDLSYMKLEKIPELNKNIINKIEHLFLNNNNFIIMPDLSNYINLKTVDINNNKLKNINNMPENILEFSCSNNKISKIVSNDNLIRLNCSNNKLKELSNFNNLEILECSDNILETLPELNNIKKIYCKNNKLTEIKNYNNLLHLTCSNNNIINLENLENLQELFCDNNNKLTNLPMLNKLEFLEIQNTNISRLIYFPNIKEVICKKNQIKQYSNKYINKIKSMKEYKDEIVMINF